MKEIEALEQVYIKEAVVTYGTDYLYNKDVLTTRERVRIGLNLFNKKFGVRL